MQSARLCEDEIQHEIRIQFESMMIVNFDLTLQKCAPWREQLPCESKYPNFANQNVLEALPGESRYQNAVKSLRSIATTSCRECILECRFNKKHSLVDYPRTTFQRCQIQINLPAAFDSHRD